MKRFIVYLAISLLPFLLNACGFQLRGTQDVKVAIKDLAVTNSNTYGSLAQALRKRLTSLGVNLHDDAPYKLVLSQTQTQRNLSLSTNTRGSEVERTLVLHYKIYGSGHLLLIDDSVESRTSYTYDTNNIVGTEVEGGEINNRLQASVLNLLIERLQFITSEQLDKLQTAAEKQEALKKEAMAAEERVLEERRNALQPDNLIKQYQH